MKNIMGKPKDDVVLREAVKETAAQAIKKKYPLVPKRTIRKKIDKLDRSLSKKRGLGL